MFNKIGARWWVILLAAVAGVGGAVAANMGMRPMYTGRTTLMVADGQRPSISVLERMASSNRVMQHAAEKLVDSMGVTPDEVLSATEIRSGKAGDTLMVTVCLPNRNDAKKAAGIVAESIRDECQRALAPHSPGAGQVITKIGAVKVSQIKNSNAPAYEAQVALEANVASAKKPGDGTSAGKMDVLVRMATSKQVTQLAAETGGQFGLKCTGDQLEKALCVAPIKDTNILSIEVTMEDPMQAKVATDLVAAAVKEVHASKAAKGGSELKTIDAAYVSVADQHKKQRLATGLVIGLSAGVLLAALTPSLGSRE